jgi:hypothetical protein
MRAAASSTVRASGPTTERDTGSKGAKGLGRRSRVGLCPTSPQKAAGMRIEPAPSLPTATGIMPAATAAAEPPEEPPE